MKKLLVSMLIAVISLAGCSSMQIAKDADKPIVYMIDAPNKTKDQLFSASKTWIAETFVSAKSVIDDADKDSGTIIAKAMVKHPCDKGLACGSKYIKFTLRIDTKDGKLRETYSNVLTYTPYSSGHYLGLTYVEGTPESQEPIILAGDLADVNTAFQGLNEQLKNYLSSETNNKNW